MDNATHTAVQESTPLSQAARIIGKFGGLANLAEALGHRNRTTVQGWQKSGYIRPKYNDEIIAAAKRHGVHLTPEDFITVDPSHEYFSQSSITPPFTTGGVTDVAS